MCSRGHCTPDRVYALADFHGACGAVGKETQPLRDAAFHSVALTLISTASLPSLLLHQVCVGPRGIMAIVTVVSSAVCWMAVGRQGRWYLRQERT